MSVRIKYWLMIVLSAIIGSIWTGFILFVWYILFSSSMLAGGFSINSLRDLRIIIILGILIIFCLIPPFIALILSHLITKNKGDNILAFIMVLLLEIWPLYYLLYSYIADPENF